MANITGTDQGETIDGTVNSDTIRALKGNDTLNGFDGNDRLFGDEGSDILNGGVGNDTMRGGDGNDRYIVDSIGDRVLENFNEGLRDAVEASVSFTLGVNIERLTLTGINAINGTGNALDNIINGNDADNVISGASGNDVLNGNDGNDILSGGAGNDTITGGLGNDTLDGGAGTNALNGGLGDDTYKVSTRGGAINTIVDTGGIDTVQSFFNFALGATIENLTLQGSGTINGTGNALNNVITGNGSANVLNGLNGDDTLNGENGNDTLNGGIGNDTLDGGAGADLLNGSFGDDTYLVDNAGDVVTELVGIVPGGGTDTVQSSINLTLAANVENLVLVGTATSGTGNTDANIITGNDLANTLDGAAGDDTLVGRLGDDLLIGGLGNDTLFGGKDNDTLVGGSGADIYAFRSDAPFNSADLGVDVINGFNSGSDKIRLDLVTFGAVTPANVAIVANDEQAALSAGLITYSVATGNLFFNQDGAAAGFGTGGQFATLNGTPAVAATDFS